MIETSDRINSSSSEWNIHIKFRKWTKKKFYTTVSRPKLGLEGEISNHPFESACCWLQTKRCIKRNNTTHSVIITSEITKKEYDFREGKDKLLNQVKQSKWETSCFHVVWCCYNFHNGYHDRRTTLARKKKCIIIIHYLLLIVKILKRHWYYYSNRFQRIMPKFNFSTIFRWKSINKSHNLQKWVVINNHFFLLLLPCQAFSHLDSQVSEILHQTPIRTRDDSADNSPTCYAISVHSSPEQFRLWLSLIILNSQPNRPIYNLISSKINEKNKTKTNRLYWPCVW